jgi:hypothetical protein
LTETNKKLGQTKSRLPLTDHQRRWKNFSPEQRAAFRSTRIRGPGEKSWKIFKVQDFVRGRKILTETIKKFRQTKIQTPADFSFFENFQSPWDLEKIRTTNEKTRWMSRVGVHTPIGRGRLPGKVKSWNFSKCQKNTRGAWLKMFGPKKNFLGQN